MITIQICIGSSCHLKGAPEIVRLLQKYIKDNSCEDRIALTGTLCAGRCNRDGVTVTVGDDVYTGVTPEGFDAFWNDKIVPAMKADE
ncbi:MAG: (2Fe-2S) ferredoxin domain-containing protein [Eubacteriales bacterium]|nr:(2Fe-2S) ferredoxin domain-containing protein [Clostridiales bacterium]MDD7301833.1 (2Fe-2S) ferredoxin domain-containing protein [Eubacteriales bacterium]MDY4435728.1 (2Fe-2S) ferredoxin domain-containing protein [Candidatus Flemingibacterium sp.]